MKHLLLIFILAFQIKSTLYACNCYDRGTIQEALKSTPIVFYGKIISLEQVSLESTIDPVKLKQLKKDTKIDKQTLDQLSWNSVLKVEVEILDKFKGNIEGKKVILYTALRGAACGFVRFREGNEFIIYAYQESYLFDLVWSNKIKIKDLAKENTIWTNQCTRTSEKTENELDELCRLITDSKY